MVLAAYIYINSNSISASLSAILALKRFWKRGSLMLTCLLLVTPFYLTTVIQSQIGVDFALKVLNWNDDTLIRLQLWDIAGTVNNSILNLAQ